MPKWIELVFAVRITTEDSYFVICGDSDLLTEREPSAQRLELDLENYGLSLCYGQPSQQLLSFCVIDVCDPTF